MLKWIDVLKLPTMALLHPTQEHLIQLKQLNNDLQRTDK